MTLAAARDYLVLATAADQEPVVTNANVETFLGQCKLADSTGRAPTDADWVPTWDLNLAEALIYERKASLCSNQVTFSRDGSKFDLSDRPERFRNMAKEARKRRMSGVDLELTAPEEVVVISE